LATQKKVQEQKRQAALAKQKQQQVAMDKKKADDKRKREEALIDKQLAEEAYQLASARKSHYQTEIDKYRALITQAISQYWIVPGTASRDVSCVLLIRVAPGGVVLDVKVTRSSGDFVLDRSAMSAVYRASPLPMPADKELVDMFRELRLTVRPEGYREG
jgi:colicin import membrane protein